MGKLHLGGIQFPSQTDVSGYALDISLTWELYSSLVQFPHTMSSDLLKNILYYIQHTTYNIQHTTYNIQHTTHNTHKTQFLNYMGGGQPSGLPSLTPTNEVEVCFM